MVNPVFEISGVLNEVLSPVTKSETLTLRSFVLQVERDKVKFQLVNARVELIDRFVTGDYLKVKFMLKGQGALGKPTGYTLLDAMNIERAYKE